MPVPDFTGGKYKHKSTGGSNVPDFTGGLSNSATQAPVSSGVPDFTKTAVTAPPAPKKKGFSLPSLKDINEFVAGAAKEPVYTGEKWNWLKNLPNEIVRTILPGAAAINDNQEEFASISNKDIAKELPGVTRDMFVEPAISYPATFYGATSKYVSEPLGLGRAPGVKDDTGAVDVKLPFIGNISNVQQRIKEEAERKGAPQTGGDVALGALKHTSFELLNGLYSASLASTVVNPRNVAVTSKEPYRPTTQAQFKPATTQGPKSFQLFEGSYRDPVTHSVFNKMVNDMGMKVKGSYNPNYPVFFQTTKVMPDGSAIGQFFQVKKPWLQMFTLGKNVPNGVIIPIATAPNSKVAVKNAVPPKAAPTTPVVPPTTVVTPPRPPITPKPPVVAPIEPVVTPPVPVAPKPPVVAPETPPTTPTSPTVPVTTTSVPPSVIDAVQKSKGFEDFGDNIVALYPEAKQPGGIIDFTKTDISKSILDEATFKGEVSLEEVYAIVKDIAEGTYKPPKPIKEPTGSASVTIKPGPKRDGPVKIAGEKDKVNTPKQLVTKTDVKNLVKQSGGKIDFTYDGGYLTYKDAKTNMRLRPSALGLTDRNLKKGQTVRITSDDLKATGTGFKGVDKDGKVVASLKPTKKLPSKPKPSKDGGVKAPKYKPQARSKEDVIKAIEQLNKFGQSQAILRKTGGVSKKAYGHFKFAGKGIPLNKKGKVELQDDTVLDPKNYMETLAHELGHALDYNINGKRFGHTLEIFGKDLTKKEIAVLVDELKAVTNALVGEAVAKSNPSYYYNKPELFARFLETMFAKPGTIEEIAPTAIDLWNRASVKHPIIMEYMEAVNGTIDKGELKRVFLRDMRQTYMKVLGTRNGSQAWDQIVNYRAMKERAKIQIEQLIDSKFRKNVTVAGKKLPIKVSKIPDSKELIFNAIESIKVTEGGEPVFGTRDMLYAKNKTEIEKLKEAGYEPLIDKNTGKQLYESVDGESYPRFAKLRYTPEQGKAFYDALSPEGKALVKDFTAKADEAKDYFNREVIKEVHGINSNLEGWVHRYWADKPAGVGKDMLKTKSAGARRMRKGQEGYEKDLEKAMTKALTELEIEKAYNHFINDFFPRVTRPIAKGEKPDDGWVEVFGDVTKGGVGLKGEVGKTVIMKDGKAIPVQKPRYQMPAEVYRQFEMLRGLSIEASNAMRVVGSINRYWRMNILTHMGSNATNFISGGLQYSAKMVNDFYLELLSGKATLPKTRSNIYALLTTLTPKGWQNAPDWVYGGDLSNNYGQFMGDESPGIEALEENIDAYGDKALKLYGLVERYWKKVIMNAEHAEDLSKLNLMTKKGLELPTKEEEELIAYVNQEVNLFAFDYDNVPVWMKNYKRSAGLQSVKPFLIYPYKYAKLVTDMAQSAFDGTLPPKERLTKILSLGTLVGLYAYYINSNREQQKTPPVGEETPGSVSSAGRIYIGTDENGNEKFAKFSKYPIVNLSEIGLQVADGNNEEAWRVIQNMIGSIGPGGDVLAGTLGYKQEYQQWMTPDVILGNTVGTFIPASRVLQDVADYNDPYKRKQTTFWQGITKYYPTTDPVLQDKLHGDKRTLNVPLEGNVFPSGDFQEGTKRTTTDYYVRNYKEDILTQAIIGIYIKRINPDIADAFNQREAINLEKNEQKFDPFAP